MVLHVPFVHTIGAWQIVATPSQVAACWVAITGQVPVNELVPVLHKMLPGHTV